MHHKFLGLFVVVCLIYLIFEVKSETDWNYAASTAGLTKLLQLEKDLLQELSGYADAMSEKIHTIRMAVDEKRKEHKKSVIDPEAYLSNPLKSFALIRRMHSEWERWQRYMKAPIGQDNINFIAKELRKMPTQRDFNESIYAMHRILETYLVGVDDMANGTLERKPYDAKMSPLDCFAIGLYLSDIDEHLEAFDWLHAAAKQYNKSEAQMFEVLGLELSDIWYTLANKYLRMDNHVASLDAISNAYAHNPNNTNITEFKHNLEEFMIKEQICNGNYVIAPRPMHCFYNSNTSAFLRLAPLKKEIVSMVPYVAIYHDVIYEREIRFIKENSKKSDGAIDETDVAGRINKRAADMTGLDLKYASQLRAINYGMSGQHPATISDDQENIEDQNFAIIFHLNDVKVGGATAFTALNVSVPAKQGTAIVFSLLDRNGVVDKRLLQASCPVLIGSKWSLVKTFNAKANLNNFFTKSRR